MKIDKYGLELKSSNWILLWEIISKAENDNEKSYPFLLNFNNSILLQNQEGIYLKKTLM